MSIYSTSATILLMISLFSNESLLTLGIFEGWGQLLCFFGMEIRGELSMSGSSSKTGCEGAAGIRTSSAGSTSDSLSADSSLDWLTGTALSATLAMPVSNFPPIVGAVEGGASLG